MSHVSLTLQKAEVLHKKKYLKNAYRVLLTRARQGMVIFVPEDDLKDTTRRSKFYDETYCYLKDIGIKVI